MKFHTIIKISFSGTQMTLEVDSRPVTIDLAKSPLASPPHQSNS